MLLLTNARVITLDERNSIAECVLIERGTIIGVANQSEFESLPSSVQRINLHGATIIPGFTDSHLHLLHYAKSLDIIDCDVSSRSECLEKISTATQLVPDGTWIRGHGWNNHHWQESEVSKEILDSAAPNHPVYLTNKSLHGAWANSLALQQCGITQNTQDPEGGRIGHDDMGAPNGILYESAVSLIENSFPETSPHQAAGMMGKAQKSLFAYGITTVHDFDRITSFRALQELERENKLLLRVRKSLPVEELDQIIGIGLQTGFGSQHLTFGGIKLFMDGALGTKTAAMLAPYENSLETGMLLIDPIQLLEISQKASANHIQMAIHAIGDLANQTLINSFARLRKWELEKRIQGIYHRIEHLQTCDLNDIKKLNGLDVIASVQPIHLASDVIAAEKWLGDRVRGTYAFKTMLKNNIPVVFGSDAPVEVPDCLMGIHTAINRTQRNNTPINGWQPQEKISPLDALKGFTVSPHRYLPLNSTKLGQISPGFNADLVVLDDFYLSPQEKSFKDLKVIKTMIDGHWVWEA